MNSNLADHAGDRLGAALDLVHNGRDLQRHFRRLHDVADKPFEHGIRRLQHRITLVSPSPKSARILGLCRGPGGNHAETLPEVGRGLLGLLITLFI
jgi:hypothetical protein